MPTRQTPNRLHLMSAREVQTAGDGEHFDGGGLVLRVKGASASWIFRYTFAKRREMGLGMCNRTSAAATGKSLTTARQLAQAARDLIADGKDPIEVRRAKKEEAKAKDRARRESHARERLTLARAARAYHETIIEPNRSDKHGREWIRALENHVPETLWHKPLADITAPEVLDFFLALNAKVPETARRVRQRLEVIFDDAEFRGLRDGNPARAIARKVRERIKPRDRGHFAALPFAEVPAFAAEIRKQKGIAAQALLFALYTASRTGEVIGANWPEFDLAAGVWTIPGARMKAGDPHIVYLSTSALAILDDMRTLEQPFVFPSIKLDGQGLSNMAMLTLLRRMDAVKRTTVHGLCRASFSTWAYDTGAARPEVIESCLAHQEQDRVKAAYCRAQFAEERRALLARWADFVDGRVLASNVVELRAA